MSKMNKKILAIIAAAAIIVIVAGGGITAFLLLRDKGITAVVNGVKITNEEYEEQISRLISQYEAQGATLPPEQLVEMRKSILDNMIMKEVLLQKSVSYEISPEEVDERISSIKGNFPDEKAFEETMTLQGFDMESLKTALSEDMRIQKFMDDTTPKDFEISDEEISNFYNENPSYFSNPEKIKASHILVSVKEDSTDEEKAKALEKVKMIQGKLDKGADFAKIAILESEGPSAPQGGDLGEFARGQMVKEFEEAAFTLPEGEISGIVETQFGYHIIKTIKKIPESKFTLDEVKEKISVFLKQEKEKTSTQDYLDSLREKARIRIIKVKKPYITEEETTTPQPSQPK